MRDRRGVLETVAGAVSRPPISRVTRVAIDGVDGAGKTHFADELGEVLRASGRSVIRASVDGFHNPRSIRYRLGRDSPEGFFHDSYDYEQLKAALLDPLSPGGSGHYRTAVFDHRSDRPVSAPNGAAAPGAIFSPSPYPEGPSAARPLPIPARRAISDTFEGRSSICGPVSPRASPPSPSITTTCLPPIS